MGCTTYLAKIKLSPGDEWSKGMEVTITVTLGNYPSPCDPCSVRMWVGLSSATSCACNDIPSDFNSFGSKDIDYWEVPCAETKEYVFKHTVTQEDIDLIESGIRRCFALTTGGIAGTCYKYDSVSVKPADPGKGDLLDAVAEPTTAYQGDRVCIYGTIKNIGGTRCLMKLRAMEGSAEVTNSGGFGWVEPGQTIEDIMMQFSMLDHNMNITVQVVREE